MLNRTSYILLDIICIGHVRIIEWVLAQGGAALCDDLGGTPLHDAAEHGQLDVSIFISNELEHQYSWLVLSLML